MPELIPMSEQDMDTLAQGFGAIAERNGILIQTCGSKGDFSRYHIRTSGCITTDMLGDANGIRFRKLKHKGARQGCHRIENRDIGAYDTCLNGCKYCYANKNPQKAAENYKFHDRTSPLLLGAVKPEDNIIRGAQKSFLENKKNTSSVSDK